MSGVESVLVLAAAVGIDGLFGEPPNRFHPVVWIGAAADSMKRFAPPSAPGKLVYGVIVALAIPLAFAAATAVLIAVLEPFRWIAFPVAALVLKTTFSVRALGAAALTVRGALARGDIPAAREALRSLCSRDSARLEAPALVAATVESVAENASDSIVAPLFYYVLAGLPAAVFYRAVNTLDAMIGHHGEYEHLGKAAARLDDLLNYVPARLTAMLLLLAGKLGGADASSGARILWRDGRKTESPNAGLPMAAMAGLLRVELEKSDHYRLGDPVEPLGASKIDDAWRIVRIAAALAAGMSAIGVLHA